MAAIEVTTDASHRPSARTASLDAGRPVSPNESIEQARQALWSDDPARHPESVRIIRSLADSGHPEASYALGTWHLDGSHGCREDRDKALGYLHYAAEHLHPDAVHDLAELTEIDHLGHRPKRSAFALHTLAAALGSRESVSELARCFYWGIGTFKDPAVAELLHRVAHPQAQLPLQAAE